VSGHPVHGLGGRDLQVGRTVVDHTQRRRLVVGALLMSSALPATAAPVSAKVRTGQCSGSPDWGDGGLTGRG
jgi:hypothetical protein